MTNERTLRARVLAGAVATVLAACTTSTATPAPTATPPGGAPTSVATSTGTSPSTATRTGTSTATPSSASTANGTRRPTATAIVGVPVPDTWRAALPTPVRMSAPSESVVWAWLEGRDNGGLGLFRSTDRGDTWAPRGLPPGLKVWEIDFVDDHVGWLVAVGPFSSRCPGATFTLWRTSDGGDRWQFARGADVNDPLCAGQASFFLIDATLGFMGMRRQGAAPGLYRTRDAGATWVEVESLPLDGANDVGIHTVRALGSALLLTTGPIPEQGTQGKRVVLRSTDGGETWARMAEADVSLGFATADRWIVLGPPGESVVTTDGGKTWQPLDTDYRQASPIPPVVLFGSAQVGYATTRSTIQRTTDGGAHWTRIPTPGSAP